MSIPCNLVSHHAICGGSYTFKSGFPPYLKSLLIDPNQPTELNLAIQPNSSPHVGTLCTLGLAFALAHRLKGCGLEVSVVCDLWDRAKAGESKIDNLTYHTTLRESGKYEALLPDYQELLREFGEVYEVEWRLRTEEEFLASKGMSEIIHRIIENRALYAPALAPETGVLAIRGACPQCGLIEKYGINNTYSSDGWVVGFKCPLHGVFELDARKEPEKFMFNCPLFNLVIGLYYESIQSNYIAICGADYAGTWMEQLLWRFLKEPIIIVYTPMISDWSGAKISKSRYLQHGAYDYLREAGQEYLLSYDVFKKENKNMEILRKEVELWIDEPFRLFRGYSLHYLHLLFEGEFMAHGTKEKYAIHE